MVMSIISSVLSLILVIGSAIFFGISNFLLLSGLGQAITAIISSGFACRATCSRSFSGERIIYVSRDDLQDIMRNNGNRWNGATALTGKVLQFLIVIKFSIEKYVRKCVISTSYLIVAALLVTIFNLLRKMDLKKYPKRIVIAVTNNASTVIRARTNFQK